METQREPLAKRYVRDAARKAARREKLQTAQARESLRRKKVGENFLKNVERQRRYVFWNLFWDRFFTHASAVLVPTSKNRRAAELSLAANLKNREQAHAHYSKNHDLARPDNAYALRCLAETA